jgi:hypothetical protein
MLRAGVRFALLDDIVLDYFPSSLWSPDGGADRPSAFASLSPEESVRPDAGSGAG